MKFKHIKRRASYLNRGEKIKIILATLASTLAAELVILLFLTGTGVLTIGSGNIGTSTGNEVETTLSDASDAAASESTAQTTVDTIVEETDEPTGSTTESNGVGSTNASSRTSKAGSSSSKTTTTTKATTTTKNTGDNDGGWVEGWY